jgi:CHAT domain-containing protein/Tfp pilus assembly protein PilF
MRRPSQLQRAGLASALVCTLLAAAHVYPYASTARGPLHRAPQETGAPTEARVLERGRPVERELRGGERHVYRLRIAAGDYLAAVVEQKGIDVVATLYGPAGQQLLEVDSPNGVSGPEPLYWLAEQAGDYRLEVRSLEAAAPPGRYEARIEELRPATPQDKTRLLAAQTTLAGEQLDLQGTAAAMRQALEKYKQALPLWRELQDRRQEAAALNLLGRISADLGETQQALDYYGQSLQVARAANDVVGQATVLTNVGAIFSAAGEKQKAIELYQKALPLWQQAGERAGAASVLNNLGKTYSDLGDKQQALDFYTRALALKRAADDHAGEATVLANIGSIYTALGQPQRALEYYEQALPLLRAVNNLRGAAVTLSNVASIYDGLGEKERARTTYTQALAQARTAGDRVQEATTLLNLGVLAASVGEVQQALDYTQQALALARAAGNPETEATTLQNLGEIYSTLGAGQRALDYYQQALSIFRTLGDRAGEGQTLSNMGTLAYDRSDLRQALAYFEQALQIKQSVGDRYGAATTLTNMGATYVELKDYARALDYFNQALTLRRAVLDRAGEASTLLGLGRTYFERNELQPARLHFRQALALTRAVEDRPTEAVALYDLAVADRKSGELTAALEHARAALAIIEAQRMKVASSELRTSYFATVQDVYAFYIDLLMQLHAGQPRAGYDRRAWEASERARARSLLDTLGEARADIRRGIEPALLAHERALAQQLSDEAERRIRLHGEARPDAAQIAAADRRFADLSLQLQQAQTEIRRKSPRYAALTQPQPITPTTLQSDLLDADTALLTYFLGAERSYLWVITRRTVRSYQLPGRTRIEALARRVYQRLSVPPRRTLDSLGLAPQAQAAQAARDATDAAELSRLVIGPAASQLNAHRLLVVSNGLLQYVPFAALPWPGAARGGALEPLLARYEVVTLPSASTLAVLRRETSGRTPAPKTLAILADPVFQPTDVRVSRPPVAPQPPSASAAPPAARGITLSDEPIKLAADSFGAADAGGLLRRLPGTRREAERIAALVAPQERKQALDFAANLQTATSAELGAYRFVHFATHGLLNTAQPELSGVVFSLVDESGAPQNGFLRAGEIFNLNLPADLVVLSACQTGVGKEVRGEGLISLTRGFMYAGAPRVVVSLWNVDDDSTAELMARFYEGMLRTHLPPAAALRAAQLALRSDPRWRAPYYWAAFTLQGEWR